MQNPLDDKFSNLIFYSYLLPIALENQCLYDVTMAIAYVFVATFAEN